MKVTRRIKLEFYLAPLCLLLSGIPLAHAKNTLNCTIVDQDGKPVAKQEFTATAAGSTKNSKKKTDSDGVAKFSGLDDGSYIVSGEVQGYVPTKSAPIEVSGNAEKPCKVTVLSTDAANAKMKDVQVLLQTRKFKEGAEAAKQLVEIMPGEAGTHYLLAMAYAYMGDDQALPEIKKAAELNSARFQQQVVPVQLQILNIQADQLKQKGDFPGAVKKYEAMLTLSPNDPVAYYNMAVTYAAQKKYDEALKNIDLVLAIKPDDPDAKQRKDVWQKLFDEQVKNPLKK